MRATGLRLLLVPIFVISFVTIGFYFQYTVDDAYIVARYAENLADWGSLVYNPGERISALTSPLHALLEAVLYRLTGATLTSYKFLSLILLLSSVMLAAWLFRRNRYSLAVCLSVLLLSPSIILWTFGGLETPLLLFLITALTVLVFSTREFGLGRLSLIHVLSGLAFVTRFDSILFTAPLVIYTWIWGRHLTRIVIAALSGSLIPALWILVSTVYYGDLLPTSYYVKTPSVHLRVMLDNFIYIAQYMVFVGFVPFAGFMFLASRSRAQLFRLVMKHALRLGWLYLGLLFILGYGLTVATTHMMFSFRFFVPYIPSLVIVLADLFRQATQDSPAEVTEIRLSKHFNVFLVSVIAFQLIQIVYAYKYSVNPLVLGAGEYTRVGIESSIELMRIPGKAARDIRLHWEKLPQSRDRPLRISTFAGGALPYRLKGAYIYESLVSYRHHCTYDMRLSADYLNIIAPLHGTVEAQLPKPVRHYGLISSYPLVFEGREETYLVFYDPSPDENRLPSRVDEACR